MSKAPVIVCTILGILLISSILVLNLTSTTPQMPEDSPERVVQVFLEYVSKDAHNSAYELLSKELKEVCSSTEFAADSYEQKSRYSNATIKHINTQSDSFESIVLVEVIEIESSFPIGTSENSYQETFNLTKENSNWKINRLQFPINCFSDPETLDNTDE